MVIYVVHIYCFIYLCTHILLRNFYCLCESSLKQGSRASKISTTWETTLSILSQGSLHLTLYNAVSVLFDLHPSLRFLFHLLPYPVLNFPSHLPRLPCHFYLVVIELMYLMLKSSSFLNDLRPADSCSPTTGEKRYFININNYMIGLITFKCVCIK